MFAFEQLVDESVGFGDLVVGNLRTSYATGSQLAPRVGIGWRRWKAADGANQHRQAQEAPIQKPHRVHLRSYVVRGIPVI